MFAHGLEGYYDVDYLCEDEISAHNNTLHFATESEDYKLLASDYGIRLVDHNRHVTCSKSEILNYRVNWELPTEVLVEKLNDIDKEISHIRYIILTKLIK